MTIKHILCPTDFSDAAAHALDQAVAVAGWYKARVTVLHVCNEPERDVERARLHRETAAQREVAAAAGGALDVTIASGQPARGILDAALRLPADMLVMGTHGAGGFERLVLGSVTEKVLRKASCPVLTVPPHAHTRRRPFARVLCAVDFSESSLAGLAYAVSLARQSSAALTAIHVIEWPWQEPPAPSLAELEPATAEALAEYRRYCEAGASARLKSCLAEAAEAGQETSTLIAHGKPYAEILRVAAAEDADLIAIGVRGRGAADLGLFGSTTNHVVRRAACPVLTVRPIVAER